MRPAVGLTIEPGRIAAAQVGVNGAIVIQAGCRAELDPGIVRDGEVSDSDALAHALRDLWHDHPELDKRVRIGVANARIVVRTLYLPPIDDAKQLATAVRFQAKDEIPMPLEEVVLDFHSVGVVDTPGGRRQRIILVAARRDMIMEMLTAARAAGLKPVGIDLSAFAMVRALEGAEGGSGPELFVSVGGLTNLAVAEDGVCSFTRVAGSGLESLAVELAERRELPLENARMWLHDVGLAADVSTIEGDKQVVADARVVLKDGVRRIAAEVRASLDFYQGQAGGHEPVKRVVLTGPVVAVAGFAAALEAELGLEVQERVVAGAKGVDLSALDGACLSVAAGLAGGPDPARMKAVNLIPEEARKGGKAKTGAGVGSYVVLGALGVAVLMAGGWAMTGKQLAAKQAELARVERAAQAAEAKVASLAPYKDFAALSASRVETITGLVEGRFDWSHGLREVARVLPASVDLTSLVGTASPSSVVQGAGGSGSLRGSLPVPAIDLIGCAQSQGHVAQLLARLRAIDGVKRVTLASSEKTDSAALSDSECRASERMPQFQLTVFFDAQPGMVPGAAAAGAAPPAAGAAPPAAGATAPPAAGATPPAAGATAPPTAAAGGAS